MGNFLEEYFQPKLTEIILELSKISGNKKINAITKEERLKIVKSLKYIEMTPEGVLGWEMAIVTKGGVDLKEIDAKTMKSKIVSNLFFAGEVINLNGPTGGFNLMLCWSTGFLAGQSATK